MTPLGSPPVPLPSIVNVPPDASVPPICNEPLVSAPVVNATVPRSPVIKPPPLYPSTAIRSDPVSERPALVPDKMPPLLLKSVPLVAKDELGSSMHDSANSAASRNLRDDLIASSLQ